MTCEFPRPSPGSERFDRFARLVHQTIGVKLQVSKRLMVEGRLRRRMTELGMSSVEEYFHHIFDEGALDHELGGIVDAVTTNTTDFFRETEHFRRLAEDIIPARLARRRADCAATMFKVWSAAASNGAEAYTAAMMLADHASRRGGFEWGVLGTDINSQVLTQARIGIYPESLIAPIPVNLRDRYLTPGQGAHSGQWRFVPELRRRLTFLRVNLMDTSYAVDRNIDVIFLRNVLIYFDPLDQVAVVDRLVRHLAPQGHLIVGHSESMIVRHPGLSQIAPAVYRIA